MLGKQPSTRASVVGCNKHAHMYALLFSPCECHAYVESLSRAHSFTAFDAWTPLCPMLLLVVLPLTAIAASMLTRRPVCLVYSLFPPCKSHACGELRFLASSRLRRFPLV
ncbi:unnamed protein product [Pylaiella littoralis]